MSIAEYKRDRHDALLSLNEARIRAYMQKYGDRWQPSTMEAFWAGIHMARLELKDLPPREHSLSRAWLHEHGWEPCAPDERRPMGWRLREPEAHV